jgi:hypothetical protein
MEHLMRDRGHVKHLLGETMREVGTLTFVLVPLDATFAGSAGAVTRNRSSDAPGNVADRLGYTAGDSAMDETTKQFLIPWLMVFAGGASLGVWAMILEYLDKRDRKRQQQ